MKKLLITSILITLTFISCDDIPNGVVDTADVDYQLVNINVPSEFIYSDQDSVFTTSIEFEKAETIARVWFNLLTEDGVTTVKQNVGMTDDGSAGDNRADDGVYTGRTILGEEIATGKYVINYFVEDNVTAGNNKVRRVASHTLSFLSGQQNSPPVISNLVAPDTIVVEDPRSLIELHITVSDPNGLLDISEVYFNVFGPGSSTGNKVSMFDDGQEGNGDDQAGDGVYSRIIEISPANQKGDYRFEFEAVDRVGEISNKIIHTLTVE